MWLQELYRLYPEATWRYTGKRQDVAAVEKELSEARYKMRIGAEDLRIIEESKAWTYWRWWPRLSKQIDQPVELPPDVLSHHGKRKAIETLYGAFKHIEVVSVVLRFLCPEEFGILSPPVVSLLNLSWAELEDQVSYYWRYLSVLESLRRYGGLEKVAHADMAIWAAAHHFVLPNSAEIIGDMYADEYLRDLRMRNLLEGFGEHWGQTDRERLAFARVLLTHDKILAGLVAGRCYESVLRRIAGRYGLTHGDKHEDPLHYFVAKLEAKPRVLGALGVSGADLNRWRKCRNDAVHVKPLTKARVEDLIRGVERLEGGLAGAISVTGEPAITAQR